MKRSNWMSGLISCDKIITEYGYLEASHIFNGMKVHVLNTEFFIGFLDRLTYQREALNAKTN